MNLDFGKPFNGILARLNITFMVLVWAAWGYVILAYDRPVLKTVGMAVGLIILIILTARWMRVMWIYPRCRITPEALLMRDIGPAWKPKTYQLNFICNIKEYSLPFVGFKYRGRRIFLYLPYLVKAERARFADALRKAADKSLSMGGDDAIAD